MADKERQLRLAVTKGALPKVQALLKAGVPSTAAAGEGTLLSLALSRGHNAIAALLLKEGAVPQEEEAVMLIVAAVQQESLSLLSAVIEKLEPAALEAGVNGIVRGWTPLMHAAKTGNLPAAEALIKSGALVNARMGPTGGTPLMIAAQHTRVELARLLVQHDADLEACDVQGWCVSPGSAHPPIAPDGASVEPEGRDSRSRPLTSQVVAAVGRPDRRRGHGRRPDHTRGERDATRGAGVRDDGRGPEPAPARCHAPPRGRVRGRPAWPAPGPPRLTAACDVHARPPGVAAACDRRVTVVWRRCPLESTDAAGWTVLSVAAGAGHAKLVKLLLGAGASVLARLPTSHRTPLMAAAHGGHTACIALIVAEPASGADLVNAVDSGGMSAVMIAARVRAVKPP